MMQRNTFEGQPFGELPFSFIDFETTGLSPANSHRICEVALLRIRGKQTEHRFHTLVNPQRAVDPRAFEVHRISPVMLHHAPTFDSIADEFLGFIDGSILVAHNAPFDIGFLTRELVAMGKPEPINPVIDTLVLARQLMKHRQSHSLSALSTDLGLHRPDHRAMSDVLALEGLFKHLSHLMSDLGIKTLADVMRYQRGLLPGDPELTPPPIIHQAISEKRLLRIVYQSLSTPSSHERLVRPIEVALFSGRLYLRAYCMLRNDHRSFALDKIKFMQLADR